MNDRPLPLTALRAFEAAARLLSFADAAEELSVTPAALSFQIKNLEAHLGAPLFVRRNRSVALTEAGRALAPGASSGFEILRAAWRDARRLTDSNRLTVTAGPAISAKWLAPRFGDFAQRHPDIELRLATTLTILDFARDGVDVGLRFGAGLDEGLFSEKLLDEWVAPIMRPEIAARLSRPEDLLAETLIHDESLAFLKRPPNWACWFAEAGVEVGELRGPQFSQADHSIDLALQGDGVALGRLSVAQLALRSGALVAPFPLALSMPARFRLVCPAGHETRPAVARFREWIKSEVADAAAMTRDWRIVMVD